MNDAYKDKADAQREQLEATWDKFKAELKEASADTRIAFKEKVKEVQNFFDDQTR
ncbi:hypothetical protein H3C66_02065 [Patescibacteria group bacterium]|nr:hypothetical protein [Patescibacteria group bacterium]